MNQSSFDQLESLIAERTGLKMRPRQHPSLNKIIGERLIVLGMSDLDKYIELLTVGNSPAKPEWDLIVSILTNNETYFFRDQGQIQLLRNRILPEIIARNDATRTLRLWSAGCSTGEEAYSLAILINELLPERARTEGRGWDISVLGTDIDESSLHRARLGIYGDWSFRNMDLATKRGCFHRQEEGWKISQECRSLVTFQTCNLVADQFPDNLTAIHDMDLILCRNVFIYFEPKAVHAVIDKFARALCEGGYLMTGHVEAVGAHSPMLETRSFAESDIYQRSEVTTTHGAKSQAVKLSPTSRAQPATVPDKKLVGKVNAPDIASGQGPSKQVPSLPIATDVEEASSVLIEENALLERARAFADLGRYEEAVEYCKRLINRQPFVCDSYVILASIAQERAQPDEAKRLLKMAIYLCPGVPQPYLEIGAIYRSEGDSERASKMHDTALELLQQIPPETTVGPKGSPSARDWISHLSAVSEDGT